MHCSESGLEKRVRQNKIPPIKDSILLIFRKVKETNTPVNPLMLLEYEI